LAEDQFRLFGIASRFPDGLAKQITLEERQAGVYDINVGPLRIRLLVIRDLPNEPVNAMFKLFSIVPDQLEFACRQYQKMSSRTTGIVDNLIAKYRKEDPKMATTIEELNRKLMKEAMEMASVKDRLKGLTPEQRIEGLPAEEILKRLSAQEIEAYLRTLKKKKPRKK
jgi:hypothetical protein